MACLIISAGGEIIRRGPDKIESVHCPLEEELYTDDESRFNVPSDFDLHLITQNLTVETMSDHP